MHPLHAEPGAGSLLDDFSLEITAKDTESLRIAAGQIPAGTQVALAFLPGELPEARISAARVIRELGFEPKPHFSARRIASLGELDKYLHALVAEAGVRRSLVVAGDLSAPLGPFADAAALVATGLFEKHGIEVLGIAGHPDGHPRMTEDACWHALESKYREIERRGMRPSVVTQFGFDAVRTLEWLTDMRRRGMDAPVRIGIPGPANIKTLLRFAARCGVHASTSALSKYGLGFGRVLGTAGPDRMIEILKTGIAPQHGPVHLHFYPFGGLEKTADWIVEYCRPN